VMGNSRDRGTPVVCKRLLLVANPSVLTWSYAREIAPYVDEIHLIIGGESPPHDQLPQNVASILSADFHLASLSTRRQIRRHVLSIRPDLAHIHQANSVAWHALRALRNTGIPTVLTAWGSDVLLLPTLNPLFRQMVTTNLRSADVVTSESMWTASRIRSLSRGSVRHYTLNWGIDALPSTVELQAKETLVLSCRNHKALYRVDAIIRAWAELVRLNESPSWKLVVASSGPESGRLKTMAGALGVSASIEFTGFLSKVELADLYRRSSVFVSVPSTDSASISLLEALGYGCVPVLSYVPANLEWAIHGFNGFIVDDLNDLARAIKEAMDLVGDPIRLKEVASINRALVRRKATPGQNGRKFADLYTDLLQSKARL
jgi:glycosyltransferase involved in cell wall biosynthesis